MRNRTIGAGFLALAGVALFGACTGEIKNALTSSGQGGSALTSVTGTGGDLFSTGNSVDEKLVLEPQTATVEVVNGVSKPLSFTAKYGGVQVFPGTWYVDRTDVAQVSAQGLFTPLNGKGAEVKVFAKANGQIAQALVTVIFQASHRRRHGRRHEDETRKPKWDGLSDHLGLPLRWHRLAARTPCA